MTTSEANDMTTSEANERTVHLVVARMWDAATDALLDLGEIPNRVPFHELSDDKQDSVVNGMTGVVSAIAGIIKSRDSV